MPEMHLRFIALLGAAPTRVRETLKRGWLSAKARALGQQNDGAIGASSEVCDSAVSIRLIGFIMLFSWDNACENVEG